MANVYDTNVKLQAIADAITAGGSSDPALLAKLQAIADAITNGGGGGSVTASNVSVVPTSPFVSTNLQNLSVEEANAITSNAGDITTINTALGNTSISGIGDGSVTGAISSIDGDVNTIETALGNTSISGVGDGTVTGAISTLNNSISTLNSRTNVKVANFVQGTAAPQGARIVPNNIVPLNADVIGISGLPAYDYFEHYKDSGGNIVVIQYEAAGDTRDATGGINVNIYYVER